MNSIQDIKDYIMNDIHDYNNLETIALIPIYDARKSFYDKAIVKKINNLILLYSYNTLVCAIYDNCKCAKYYLNNDISSDLLYSHTTLRHIKEFLRQYLRNEVMSKKDIIKNDSVKEYY